MILYLNQYGIVSAFVKMVKLVLWIGASGAAAALVAKLNEVTIQPDQIYAVAAVGAANVLLGGIGKYLKTNEPDFNVSVPFFNKKTEEIAG